jgi:hypothetical protein
MVAPQNLHNLHIQCEHREKPAAALTNQTKSSMRAQSDHKDGVTAYE